MRQIRLSGAKRDIRSNRARLKVKLRSGKRPGKGSQCASFDSLRQKVGYFDKLGRSGPDLNRRFSKQLPWEVAWPVPCSSAKNYLW